MNRKIQKIIFPTDEKMFMQWKLFYKGSRGYLDRVQQVLSIGKYQFCDFTTYLNGCSYAKWKKYTELQRVKLRLNVEGSFRITLVGYHMGDIMPERKEFSDKEYHLEGRQWIEIEYPENEEQIIGFEISALDSCFIYDGMYVGVYDDSCMRRVTLALAITTCNKETFVTANMKTLKKEIIESKEEEIRENIYIHVVDNGRTLTPEEWNEEHLVVHPNKNTGGAGGFARGMLEAMHQEPVATHVLLMDDDVIILPESIRRTYVLLTLLKPEYQEYFISGAMLYYEEMNVQHEDIGTVHRNSELYPLKPRLYHENLRDNLINESKFLKRSNEYAAWWYCCIPLTQIKKNGLPLPLFIRSDDVEFALRCKAKMITMNGICIWHMGFVNKYNATADVYQKYRNQLIGRAAFNCYQEIDIFSAWKNAFNKELIRFNYDAAELCLRALEDYMQGPLFLEQNSGEQINQENKKRNEKLIPLDELNVGEINIDNVYCDLPRKFIDKCIYHATKNGQRFWPDRWLRKERVAIPFDFGVVTQKQTLRKELVSVNPLLKTGAIRKLDKNRFREIYKRYKKDLKDYRKKYEVVESAYRRRASYLVSETFWVEYLQISFCNDNKMSQGKD